MCWGEGGSERRPRSLPGITSRGGADAGGQVRGGGAGVLPVHGGRQGAQAVVDQPHVALVQLQREGVVVSLVEEDAVVLVRGHLGRGMQLGCPGACPPRPTVLSHLGSF